MWCNTEVQTALEKMSWMQECLCAQLLIQNSDAITKDEALVAAQLSCRDTCCSVPCVGCGCFMVGELSRSQQG